MMPQAWKAQANDFARQLMLPQQHQLFDHWMRLWKEEADWPAYASFRPQDVRNLLPHLLIIEPRPAPEALRVRLAGSSLWDIYGGELTGATLASGAWNGRTAYWQRIYERMQEHPVPDCGHLYDPVRMSVLFWLRLPMRADNGDIWLLGLDVALSASHAENLVPLHEDEDLGISCAAPGASGMPSDNSPTALRMCM